MSDNLPWVNQLLIDQVIHAFGNTNALLISGSHGIGKSQLVNKVCLSLLKKSSSTHAEVLYKAGTHPDIHVLTSAHAYNQLDSTLGKLAMRYITDDALDKKRLSRQIGIDLIRNIVLNLSESSSLAGHKIAVIAPAEHLNISSANALLKFLEEPTKDTYLILISHDVSKLPATIRSRCMKFPIACPDVDISQNWLKTVYPDKDEQQIQQALSLATGQPLIANQYLHEEKVKLTEYLQKDLFQLVVDKHFNISILARKWVKHQQSDFILNWLCQYFSRLIKASFKSEKADLNNLPNPIVERCSINSLFEIYEYFIGVNRSYDGVIDELLLFEDLLLTIKGRVEQ